MFEPLKSENYKNASSLGVGRPQYNREICKWKNTNVLSQLMERRKSQYPSCRKPQKHTSSKNYYTEVALMKKEGVKVFKFKGSVMTPFISGSRTLTDAGIAMDQQNTIDFTINAQFLDIGIYGYNNQGISYAKGKSLGGSSQEGWFYISQDAKGGYIIGACDPPSSGSGVGGARPLIINGLQYGEFNKYKDGSPPNLLKKGYPGLKNKRYLTQRSAAYFPNQNSVTVGKTIIGYNSKTEEIIIIVQQNGADGYTMDAFRDYLVKEGYNNALSFDGSTSSLLIKDKTILIHNTTTKDLTTDSGITFSVPKQ